MVVVRSLFPIAYLVPWAVAATLGSVHFRLVLAMLCLIIAIFFNRKVAIRMGKFFATSLAVFVVFSIVVSSATCSADRIGPDLGFWGCVQATSAPTVSLVVALVAVFLMTAALEWRGTLISTVNGLGMPRDLKIMTAVAGSLIGDFSRASFRVHHARTAAGSATPKISLRNLTALPSLVVGVWTSVLTSLGDRLSLQWASDQFWDKYVPQQSDRSTRRVVQDLTIFLIGSCGLALGLAGPTTLSL